MLGAAIVFITLALIFYTFGVWAEKLQGILRQWHLAIFWAGLLFDGLGTRIMGSLTSESVVKGLNFHALTGVFAIVLMLFHAVWATYVIIKKNEKVIRTFHKFSLVVWLIWLIPYISGMFMGMRR